VVPERALDVVLLPAIINADAMITNSRFDNFSVSLPIMQLMKSALFHLSLNACSP
jgi:hypothetical protein